MSTPREVGRWLLLAACVDWLFSVSLGIVYVIATFGLRNIAAAPGILLFALVDSSMLSVLFLPPAIWAARVGLRSLAITAPILWLILAVYIVFVGPHTGRLGFVSLFVLAALGCVALGNLPIRQREA